MDYTANYIQKELIGRGHFGRVYLVYHRKTLQPFVSKKIEFQGMSEEQQKKALQQVKIHQKLKHKNILEFKEYFLENQVLIMIMEYCEFGDLSVYIKQRKQKGQNFQEPLIINLFVQMLFGLNYLHENKILHRDIKTQNIFIDSQGTIKLADFGISKFLQHTQHLATTIVGTPYYLSPQACSNAGYNFKSDVWSLGCVLYELCTLQYPFNGDNILILAKKISSEDPKNISESYSSQLAKLLKLMLQKKPEQRPTIRHILDYKYITDYLIKFKMEKPIQQQANHSFMNQSENYPIFESSSSLQNQFMDLEYQDGQVKRIQKVFSPCKEKKAQNTMDQVMISPQKQKISNFRKKCIQKMGQDLFNQVYSFMKISQKNRTSESKIQEHLRNKYPKRQFQMSMDVAQLLYLEEIQQK